MRFLRINLLYLSMISFVFVSSFAISTQGKKITVNTFKKALAKNQVYPKMPVIKEGVNTFPLFSAQAVLAQDWDSGVILYEKNADVPVLPASTTKIITALTALDYLSKKDIIEVPNVSVVGQKMGLLVGEKISVNDLLYGLLVYSANDAAEVLAHNYCEEECGRHVFIEAMNNKAKSLGLANTNFTNPAGLDDTYHHSTARDLVRVSMEAMKNPYFAEIVGTKEITVKSADGKIVHNLANINELLGKVDGVLGIKTGWTQGARENLVTFVDRDGKKIMLALLGSQDRFGETEELIDWIYQNYEWEDVVYSYSP